MTQIDGRGIQGVDRPLPLVELFQAERLVHVQATRFGDQALREVGVHTPVALLVGIGQRASRDGSGAKSQVVDLLGYRPKTRLDVAQTLAVGELRKGHAEELVPAGEALHSTVAVAPPDQPPERVPRQVVHELSENGASLVHLPLLLPGVAQDAGHVLRVQVDDSSSIT